MENNKIYTCCFFGHRKINETPELTERLTKAIENLIITKDVNTFLFGSKSEFDRLCHKVVSGLKEKYSHIKRIYVRAAYADIDDSYTKYLLESYEETYYPEKMRDAGKASYVERNQEMINQSNFCIVYYDENYRIMVYNVPCRSNPIRQDFLTVLFTGGYAHLYIQALVLSL